MFPLAHHFPNPCRLARVATSRDHFLQPKSVGLVFKLLAVSVPDGGLHLLTFAGCEHNILFSNSRSISVEEGLSDRSSSAMTLGADPGVTF